MSGIGELAYTLLLGWMRALSDWIWSLSSGGGGSGAWQWFLSNWKVWLVILVIGGLVVDWLMWVVRWRPYRLLSGRFRRAPAGGAEPETWDAGVGYYEHETAMDTEPSEWTDLTMSTLSEIDPNWAGNVVMEREMPLVTADHGAYYQETYEEPVQAQAADSGYWDETPDEAFYEPEAEPSSDTDIAFSQDLPYMEEAPYEEAPYEEAPYEEPTAYDQAEYVPYTPPEVSYDPAPEEAPAAQADADDEDVQYYSRPGFWPGSFRPPVPYAEDDKEEAPAPKPEEDFPMPEFDPFFMPEETPSSASPRRRRRGIRESAREEWQPEDPLPYSPQQEPRWQEPALPAEDVRPSRLVKPEQPTPPAPTEDHKRRGLRTVTGKPAQRHGLFRFSTAQDEPIAGLPPLQLDDPFLPAAQPGNPDFEPDDGEEI